MLRNKFLKKKSLIPPEIIRAHNSAAEDYFIGFAKQQLKILEREMSFQEINVGYRTVSPYSNVTIEAWSSFSIRIVKISVSDISGDVKDKGKKTIEQYFQWLIQAKGTHITVDLDKEEASAPGAYTYAPKTQAMIPNRIYSDYKFAFIPSYISLTSITNFTQVRYTKESKIASLNIFRSVSSGGDVIQHIQVIGERNVKDFILSIEYINDLIVGAAFSDDLSILYITYSVMAGTVPASDTAIFYQKYTTVDGEWSLLSQGPIDYSGMSWADTSIDGNGNVGTFYTVSDLIYTGVDNSNPEAYIMDVENSSKYKYSYSHYNIESSSFSPSNQKRGFTVAKVGSSWDYCNIYSSNTADYTNYTKNHGTGTLQICSPVPYLALATTDTIYRGGHGFEYSWTIGDSGITSAEELTGQHSTAIGESEIFNNCGDGGGHSFAEVTSEYMSGIKQTSNLHSHITASKDVEVRTYTPYRVDFSWDTGFSGLSDGWYGLPAGNPNTSYTSEFLDQVDLAHPIQDENVSDISNSFISHDQNLNLTFCGVKYTKVGIDSRSKWRIYATVPGSDSFTEITSLVSAAFYNKLKTEIRDGHPVEMTEDAIDRAFDDGFECIYFRAGEIRLEDIQQNTQHGDE